MGNENCFNSGVCFDLGLDINGDGVLGDDEIIDINYVCVSGVL